MKKTQIQDKWFTEGHENSKILEVLNSNVSESVVGTHWFCLPSTSPLLVVLTLPLPGLVWDSGTIDQVIMSSWAQWLEVSFDTTIAYQRELHGFFWRKKKETERRTFLSFLLHWHRFWRHTPIMAGNLLLLKGESLLRMGSTQCRGDMRRRGTGLNDIFPVSKSRYPWSQRTHRLFRHIRKLNSFIS